MKKPDFSGYATRSNILCSDGRVIGDNAFKHQNGDTVPLVWQHDHNSPDNVMGHVLLENRKDGVYCYAKFNDTPAAQNAKKLVEHGDIKHLSIYANKLEHQGNLVRHGYIREVSLVLTGANPGAFIDTLSISHSGSDGESAIIYTNDSLKHGERTDNMGLQAVYDSMTDEQKELVAELVGNAVEETEEELLARFEEDDEDYDDLDEDEYYEEDDEDYDDLDEDEYYEDEYYEEDDEDYDDLDEDYDSDSYEGGVEHSGMEQIMRRNIFKSNSGGDSFGDTLSHAETEAIFKTANDIGSLKDAFLAHAEDYGIKDIDLLFPEAHNVTPTPAMISRNMDWVSKVMNGVRTSPFSFVKSMAFDITAEEARARGYVKGEYKKEEVIKLLRRKTGPTTIYKKQKLDRDDMLDIKDFDVVAFLKAELRIMLNEEIARSILIGDGREVDSADKIDEEKIRPIWKDNNLYAHHHTMKHDVTPQEFIKEVIRSRKNYKGKGNPSLFIDEDLLTEMLLIEDTTGRAIYDSIDKLATRMRVSEIIPVTLFSNQTRVISSKGKLTLRAIMVNLQDYTVGAHEGAKTGMFEDFDLDYNKHKYLLESRLSGALTQPKSAIVYETKASNFNGDLQDDSSSVYPPYTDKPSEQKARTAESIKKDKGVDPRYPKAVEEESSSH